MERNEQKNQEEKRSDPSVIETSRGLVFKRRGDSPWHKFYLENRNRTAPEKRRRMDNDYV